MNTQKKVVLIVVLFVLIVMIERSTAFPAIYKLDFTNGLLEREKERLLSKGEIAGLSIFGALVTSSLASAATAAADIRCKLLPGQQRGS